MGRTVVASIHVQGTSEELGRIICNPDCYPEIADPTERMIDVPDDEMGVGYVYKEYGGICPFIGESEWRVAEFDPVRRQVHVWPAMSTQASIQDAMRARCSRRVPAG